MFVLQCVINLFPRNFFLVFIFIAALTVATPVKAGWLGISFKNVTIVSSESSSKVASRSVIVAGKSSVDVGVVRWGDGSLMNPSRKTIVTGVVTGSPADTAGLKVSDEILTVQGKKILTSTQIPTITGPLSSGALISIEVRRAEKVLTTQVELGTPDKFTEKNKPLYEQYVQANKYYSLGQYEEAIHITKKLIDDYSLLWGDLSQILIDLNLSLSAMYSSNANEIRGHQQQAEVLRIVRSIFGENTNVYHKYQDHFRTQDVIRSVKTARENGYEGPVSWGGSDDVTNRVEPLNMKNKNNDIKTTIDWILSFEDTDPFANALRLNFALSETSIDARGEIKRRIGNSHKRLDGVKARESQSPAVTQDLYKMNIQYMLARSSIPVLTLIDTMRDFGRFYAYRGDIVNGTKMFLNALAISQKYYGVPRPDVMIKMSSYLRQLDPALSEAILFDAQVITKDVYGDKNFQNAALIVQLASIQEQKATSPEEARKAEELYLEYLDIVTEISGKESPSYIGALQLLATFYNKFDKEKAKELMAQVARTVGENEIQNDGMLEVNAREEYANQIMDIEGDYIQALGIYEETVEIKKKLLGEEDNMYLSSLGVLAWLYQLTGDYQQAIEIYKSTRDQLRLAGVYQSLGEYQRVIKLLKQFESQNKDHATKPMTAATIQETIADANLKLGNYQEANQYYQLSLDTVKEAFPGIFVDSMPSIGTGKLYGLAESYEGLGDLSKAEFFYKKVLEYEKIGPDGLYGAEGTITAEHMVGLSRFYNRSGQWNQANPLLEQSSSILAKTLGKQNPVYSAALSEQSLMFGGQGLTIKSFNKQAEALELQGAFVERLAAWADESRLHAYAAKMEINYDLLYSLIGKDFPGGDGEIKRALELHLNYKGRIMEVLSTRARFAVLSKDPTVSNLIEELRLTTARISQLQLNPPKLEAEKFLSRIETLEEKRQQLEESVASQSAEFAKDRSTSAVTLEELSSALPQNSVYIDFVDYRKFNYKKNKWADDRYYLAFLVTANDDGQATVTIKDLGSIKVINEMVTRLRQLIAGGGDRQRGVAGVRQVVQAGKFSVEPSGSVTPAENLYKKLFEPMEKEILNAQTIFVAPSGNLNLIPLELSSKPGSSRPLSDDYEFIYCLGRDLVSQKQSNADSEYLKNRLVSIVAAPNYADPGAVTMQDNGLQQSFVQPLSRGDVKGWPVIFESLPGTLKEADTIQTLAEASNKVFKLTGGDATEAAFKNLRKPSVLHVATHGFFLEAPRIPTTIGTRGVGGVRNVMNDKILASLPHLLNPLLRSGLALAGANRLAENKLVSEGEEDGILMAAEVVGMDLFGTDLVVLSACETGLGDVQRGEGVFGLRRAFKIAGVKNILMSLWSVPDEETAWLMEEFYKRYFKGESPASALKGARQAVRVRLIERDGIDNPFYWGAFVLEGARG